MSITWRTVDDSPYFPSDGSLPTNQVVDVDEKVVDGNVAVMFVYPLAVGFASTLETDGTLGSLLEAFCMYCHIWVIWNMFYLV